MDSKGTTITAQDIYASAQYFNVDLASRQEYHLLPVIEAAIRAPVPDSWTEYLDSDGGKYYVHNRCNWLIFPIQFKQAKHRCVRANQMGHPTTTLYRHCVVSAMWIECPADAIFSCALWIYWNNERNLVIFNTTISTSIITCVMFVVICTALVLLSSSTSDSQWSSRREPQVYCVEYPLQNDWPTAELNTPGSSTTSS